LAYKKYERKKNMVYQHFMRPAFICTLAAFIALQTPHEAKGLQWVGNYFSNTVKTIFVGSNRTFHHASDYSLWGPAKMLGIVFILNLFIPQVTAAVSSAAAEKYPVLNRVFTTLQPYAKKTWLFFQFICYATLIRLSETPSQYVIGQFFTFLAAGIVTKLLSSKIKFVAQALAESQIEAEREEMRELQQRRPQGCIQ
jgi:hypothetical protein